MCGLLGCYAASPEEFPQSLFWEMANEVKIRGFHATGLTSSDGTILESKVEATGFNWFDRPNLIDKKSAILHCRYSTTSDLTYNQPIIKPMNALIHNGVVSQAAPSEWEDLFGVKCETTNDSEILIQLWNSGRHPLEIANSSQACILLEPNRMYFWRNEQRPLYYHKGKSFVLVSSTRDIFARCHLSANKCDPCVEYSVGEGCEISERQIRESMKDLQ